MINFLLNHTPLLYWTQSLWRDEAFSVWIAQDSLSEVIRRTGSDFNPPLYYLLLNVWMRIFARSEIALRSLSVVFFLLFLIVIYKFAQKLFKSRQMAIVTAILAGLNPMLLYFAFELRMYSLLTLITTLSMYFLYTQNWLGYIIAATFGMYTQPFMAFVVLSQSIYLTFTGRFKTALRNGMLIGFLYLPWVPTLITQFKASGPMWMYPVDLNLILSVLGNLFFGYEGTPGDLWWIMKLTSLTFVIICIWLWRQSKKQQENLGLFLLWLFLPVFFVLAISLVKPIYVHRYLIFSTVAEVFIVALALSQIRQTFLQKVSSVILILTLLLVNVWTTSFHHKVNLQKTFREVNPQLKPGDQIYAGTPLVYYESLYYAPTGSTVLLYNPDRIVPPRYVGNIGMPQSVWATSFPSKPRRAFLIMDNGDYEIMSK